MFFLPLKEIKKTFFHDDFRLALAMWGYSFDFKDRVKPRGKML